MGAGTGGSPSADLIRYSKSRPVVFIAAFKKENAKIGEITRAVAFLHTSRMEALVKLIKLCNNGPKIKMESSPPPSSSNRG